MHEGQTFFFVFSLVGGMDPFKGILDHCEGWTHYLDQRHLVEPTCKCMCVASGTTKRGPHESLGSADFCRAFAPQIPKLAHFQSSLERLESLERLQVPVACGDCSTSSSAFLSISCDAAILPELNHSDGGAPTGGGGGGLGRLQRGVSVLEGIIFWVAGKGHRKEKPKTSFGGSLKKSHTQKYTCIYIYTYVLYIYIYLHAKNTQANFGWLLSTKAKPWEHRTRHAAGARGLHDRQRRFAASAPVWERAAVQKRGTGRVCRGTPRGTGGQISAQKTKGCERKASPVL